MRKVVSFGGFLAVLLLTLWIGRYFYIRSIYVVTENAFQMADIVSVSPDGVSGRIVRMNFRESQTVRKGDILFLIDNSTYVEELRRLEKQLSALSASRDAIRVKLELAKKELPLKVLATKKRLEALKKTLRELKSRESSAVVEWKTAVAKSRSLLSAVREGFKASKTALENAERKYRRYARLYKKRVISKEQFEEIETLYRKAKADYALALARLEEAKENLKLARSLKEKVDAIRARISRIEREIEALGAELKVSTAELGRIEELASLLRQADSQVLAMRRAVERARIILSRTRVRSPVSGIVAKKWREEGDFVSPGMPVYSIYDPDTFYVLAWVDEDKVSSIGEGSPARVYLLACGQTFNGKVYSVGASAGSVFSLIPRDTSQGEYTRVTQRIPVKIKVEDVPLYCIKPGTNVTVYIKKK